MNCPNCGAACENYVQNCPYCDAENINETDQQYKNELFFIDQNIQRNLRSLPSVVSKKISKPVITIFVTLVIITMLSVIYGSIVANNNSKKTAKEEAQHQIKLEEFYKIGNYNAIHDYFNQHDDLHSARFDKYSEVSNAFSYLQNVRDSKACFNGTTQMLYNNIYFALNDGTSLLKLTNEAINDNVVRTNETILQEFQNETLLYFHENLKLTNQEIEQMLDYESSNAFEQLQTRLVKKLNLN